MSISQAAVQIMEVKMAAVCRNSDEDIVFVKLCVELSEDRYSLGEHYDNLHAYAESLGLEVLGCFDEHESAAKAAIEMGAFFQNASTSGFRLTVSDDGFVAHDPGLAKIVMDTANRVRDSITVEVDSSLPSVAIVDDSGQHDDLFMQGDEASQFIDEVDSLYEKAGTVGRDDAELCVAAPYAETLFN